MNYIDLFVAEARKNGDKAAFVDRNASRVTSYAELDRLSSLAAGKIRAMGCNTGDFVTILMDSCMEYVAAYLGAMKAGCAVVPLLPFYPEERIAYISEDCGAKLMIREDFLADAEQYAPCSEPAGDGMPALVVYTSGSTGNPKGVCHSVRGLCAAALRQKKDLFGNLEEDRFAAFAPFTFVVSFSETYVRFLLGRTVYLIPEETKRSTEQLITFYDENRIETSFIPPQILRLLDPKRLHVKTVFTGSEAIRNICLPNTRLINAYGQSETLSSVAFYTVTQPLERTPIGKLMSDLTLHILDENGRELPAGETGELCIEGCFDVCYLNDPDKTAKTFVKLDNGNTLLHTGDNVYLDENSDIVYVSRKDWMVKINGQRVETMEVERTLNAIDGIAVSAVRAWTDRNKQTYLAGYYQPSREISEEEIRQALGRSLPEYMIPRFLIPMAALPKNMNGKLDRRALPEPDLDSYRAAWRAPETETERLLCDGFSAALNCGRVGADDDFIAMGGDSVKVLRLLDSVELPGLSASMILLGRTPSGIAKLLESAKEDTIPHTEEIPSLCPLTEAQLGVYMECAEAPESLKYNIPAWVRLPEDTDIPRYADAVRQAAAAHRVFNVTVEIADGIPCMRCQEKDIAVSETASASAEEALARFVRPFDLTEGPLYRFELCHIPGGVIFLFDVHHLIFDGASLEVFLNQIELAYEGGGILPEALNIFDISAYEKKLKQTDTYRAAQDYFRAQLEGVSVQSIPGADRTSAAILSGSGTVAEVSCGYFDADDVSCFVKSLGLTENTLLLGAFAYTLKVFAGTEEVCFATVNNGRHDSRLAGSIGMFVKTLPLHFSVSEQEEVPAFLKNVQDTFFETMQHDCISFGELAASYGVSMDVSFVYQAEMMSGANTYDVGEAVSALDVMVFREGHSYRLLFRYDRNCYTEAYIRSLVQTYLCVVTGMLKSGKLAEIRLTTDRMERLADEINNTDYPVEPLAVHRLFEKEAAVHPDAPAVSAAGERLTYAELDTLANRAAAKLCALGLKHEGIVGIVLPRRKEALVVELAVWKASGAFLPMTPAYPDDRVQFCLEDSGAQFVITDGENKSARPELFSGGHSYRVLTVEDLLREEASSDADAAPSVEVAPEQLAYCIYTSGSTGKPKGVMIEHRNFCNFVNANGKNDETRNIVTNGSVMLSIAALSFDFSLLETWLPLCNGLTVCIASDEEIHDPFALAKRITEDHVDLMAATPSFIMGIIDIDEVAQALKQIRCFDFGAEAFPGTLYEKLRALRNDSVIINGYGPTETTVSCISKVITGPEHITIGTPAANVRTYLMDPMGRMLPAGAPGELIIAGDGVGRGYMHLPEKTAEVFFTLHGQRAYRSGDFCRLNADGEIEFFGRLDNQVKLRGLRVELDEIENAMLRIKGMQSVKVVMRRSGTEDFLAGFYTADHAVSSAEIQASLKETLPAYMIPAALMQLEIMPLNANGKINKAALPEITFAAAELIAPENVTQQKIFDQVAEVLGHANFGVDTDLYQAGLASLGAIRLTAMLDRQFGIPFNIAVLKECSTVRKIEAYILKTPAFKAHALQPDYPLTQTQEGIAAECLANPGATAYNIPSLIHLGSSVDAQRLINALIDTVNAHPYLKTRLFTDENGRIRAKRCDDAEPCVTFIEGEEPDIAKLIRPFDLFADELYRLSVFHNAGGCTLFSDFHHIAFDGTSMAVFFTDLDKAYAGENLSKESYTGFDAALDEADARSSGAYEKAKEYYHSLFDDCDPDNLPFIEPESAEAEAGNVSIDLPISHRDIEALCRKYNVSENALFNSVFGYTLCSYIGKDDAVYATIYNGRSDSRKTNSVSMYVKTLPVRCIPGKDESISEFVQSTANQLLGSMANDIYSFADISSAFGIRSDVLFAYQGKDSFPETLCGDTFSIRSVSSESSKAAVLVQVFLNAGGYRFSAEYRKDRYSEALMQCLLETMGQVISEFASKTKLCEIEPCSENQLKKLDSFNPSQYPEYSSEETVVSLFRSAAEKYPDITALVFKDKRYTYRQLDEITDVLSVYIAQAVGQSEKQPVVSILIPRNEYMAIIPIAAQKAGCCFQPLDPSYPKERLNFMVNDADASLVFADPSLADILSDYSGSLILTSALEDIIREGRNAPLPVPAKSDDMFILLYTSGSTGTPKGVILEQRNLVAYCAWYREYHSHVPGDALACYASFGFDVHMSEIYASLTNGYTCHIIPEEIRLDLIALNRYFEENNIVGTFLTTAVGVQFAQSIDTTSLKVLTTGGEKLVSLEPPKDYQLINGYGPTETTITATTKRVFKKEENIPVGKPMSTVRCYVIDKYMHLLPVGASGELMIAGPQVARGYLNRPEKTAEVFIRDPFTAEQSDYLSRAYRTGDIVRWRQNGDIEFIGRRDGQVKIHGFRIELKEIEAVIREYPEIKDVTVQALDGQGGEKYIAAYVVSDDTVNADALKQFIAGKKPAYMIPAAIMQLEKIPLNTNQKVDRKALPVPELNSVQGDSPAPVADLPLNALEAELKALAAQVLGTENITLADSLSRLGLTSISAIQLATLVYKKFGVSVKATELVASGTLRSMEDAIVTAWLEERTAPKKDKAEKKPVQPKPQEGEPVFYPLSFTQQGVYAECQAAPENRTYNLPYCLSFPAAVTAEMLKSALLDVIAAHPAFATRFVVQKNNEIGQIADMDAVPEIPVTAMSAEEFGRFRDTFSRPFRLLEEPLYRFAIVQAEKLCLMMDIHHLIIDGGSVDIFLRDLCDRLEGKAIEAEDYTCFDAIADEKLTEEAEHFFEQYLAEYEESTQLIPDVYDKDTDHSEGTVRVPTDLSSVAAFASKNGVTPATVYLAAEHIACARYCSEDFAAISTVSNGRSNLRLHHTLGMFVNTLPLFVKISDAEETLSFVRRVGADFTAVLEHENYPFARVAKKFDFRPMVSYAYQVGVLNETAIHGEPINMEELSLDRAKLPVSVFICGTVDGACVIQINYDKAMFSEHMMLGFAESIENAVRGLLEKKTLSEISLTNEKQWQVLDSYNPTFDLNYDHSDTAVSLFRKQAALHPEKTAAVFREKEYTYRALDELTDSLSEIIYGELTAITGLSSLAEQVVPIISSRNENTFILPLAVLKAGAAYEPLDPGYPSERLNFMVQDAGAKLLLAERGLEERVNGFDGSILFIDELYARLADPQHSHTEEIPAVRPQDLLIMLYTSGTTGTPKGVQLEHGNLVAYAYGSSSNGFYTEHSKTAAYASFGFDVNMADTFCTLLNGGTVYVIPEEMRMNLNDLAAYFDEAGITDVLLTTQVGVQFISNYPKMKTLKTLTVGGEKLPAIHPEELSYQVNNGYGPTENCCGVSLFPVHFWEPNIPIGKPMKTIHAFILDKTGHRLPAGAAGEYCLSGPQVGRRYLNRPDKTAEAFENCPFNDFRMYHTGDIVRYRQNGDVEFVGRKDGQVKIRGFRVELKEIEAVIHEYEGISDVTVQAYDFETGGKYLAAFIVSDKKIDSKALSEFIKSQKPAYMVPAVIQQIDAIPLTVNRKVDKKALPKPEVQKGEYAAPQTKAEEDFCRILGEVLGIEKVSAEDDFFDLGGSSISAMKVVLAAEKAGYDIVYQDVFDNSTPRLLAASAAAAETASTATAEAETVLSDTAGSFYGPGTSEIGRDGYDYTAINALLRQNTLEAFRTGELKKVDTVLLTGSTGYLGIHVLRHLIDDSPSKVYCLSRSKNGVSGESRLKELLQYYFGTDFADLFGSRLFVIEGDATDADTLKGFDPAEEITVINCAANVAHFAKGDAIERANVDSVNNLIEWCIGHHARLVHISTCSVAGNSENNMPPAGFHLTEHVLFAGQEFDSNQYFHSKFMGERAVYEAILQRGLQGKVIRMSNLAPRFSDGVFQKNYQTNSFMSSLAAYKALGMVSYSMMSSRTEFSPIDYVSRAILLLATTPQQCTCFMLTNPNQPFVGNVVLQLATEDAPIRMVEDEELFAAIQAGIDDPVLSEKLRPLLAYNAKSSSSLRIMGLDDMDATYTTQILYRLGYVWPVTDDAYVQRFAEHLNQLNFFS